MSATFRPPRNTICASCYDGARLMNSFLKDDELDESTGRILHSGHRSINSLKDLLDVFRWMEERRQVEENLKENISFMRGLLIAFNEGIHTDILLMPNSGPPVPAHKALLATKSQILKTMLEFDEYCGKAPVKDTISFPELNHDQLRSLVEFLYAGTLAESVMKKHVHVLLLASDKYAIHYLKKFCEEHLLRWLEPENVLDILEASEVCSSKELRERSMELIEKHVDEIIFSSKFDLFALKNAHLCVEISRMLAKDLKETKKEKKICIQ